MPEVRRLLQELFITQHFGVLCTQSEGQPYGSVMCFAASEDLRRIWMATPRKTRKFTDIQTNDRVAFVVENTANNPSDAFDAVATTVTGRAQELDGPAREHAVAHYLAKNPQLTDFVSSPQCAVIELAVASYQVVSHFQEAVQVQVV